MTQTEIELLKQAQKRLEAEIKLKTIELKNIKWFLGKS